MPASDTTLPAIRLDQLPLQRIASAEGTPCYVYSAPIITARLAALRDAFAAEAYPHALHYAMKANSALGVVGLMREGGAQADANSVGEIEVALRAGYEPREIVFTGVGKSPEELERAVALELKAINAESAGELDRIDAIARRQGRRTRVALRVNPDVDARSHPHISTGLRTSKFGVALDDAAQILVDRRASPGLEIIGVHVHVGSQITTLGPLCEAARKVADLAVALRADGLPLSHLDLGGGLGIVYDGGEVPTYDAFARALVDVARPTGLTLIVEPGRTLVGPAGVLLARVIDVKPYSADRGSRIADRESEQRSAERRTSNAGNREAGSGDSGIGDGITVGAGPRACPSPTRRPSHGILAPSAGVGRPRGAAPTPRPALFVVLDAGMTELLRPALYGAFHRIEPVEPSSRPVVSCDVVGPVCESSDTFGRARDLPEPQVGDLVAIMDAGAYGAVMSSTYNRRPLPPEVLVQGDGSWRLLRRRQTIDEMLALEEGA